MTRDPHAASRFCVLATLVALPVAWAAAGAGYGLAVRHPISDLAAIALWSTAEELVFRGALQPAIGRVVGGRGRHGITPANALTSALFALFHLWRHPPIVALLVFPVSLVFGKVRELSGRVWPAALLHFLFNALLYAASALRAGG